MTENHMSELERLEKVLEDLFASNSKPSYESVFKVGISFGREMQASNNFEYECRFWKSVAEKKRQEKELAPLVKNINEQINKHLVHAVKLHIERNSSWRVVVKRNNLISGALDKDIVKKCGLQLTGARKDSFSDEIDLEFTISENLYGILSKYSSHSIFSCVCPSYQIDESDKAKFTIDDIDEFSTFYLPSWKGVIGLNKEQFLALSNELERNLLLLYMSDA